MCSKRKDDVRGVVETHSDTLPHNQVAWSSMTWSLFPGNTKEGFGVCRICPEFSPSSQAYPIAQAAKFSLSALDQT